MLDTIRGIAILGLLLVRDRFKTVYSQIVGALSDDLYDHARCVIDGGMVEVKQTVLIQFLGNKSCKASKVCIAFIRHRLPIASCSRGAA